MDIIKFYSDPFDPVHYALAAIPLVALATFFLRGRLRVIAAVVFTCLPTLLFIGYVIISLPATGFPIDFQKHSGLAMGMVMIPAYNLFWIPPALLGLAFGSTALWIKRKITRSAKHA